MTVTTDDPKYSYELSAFLAGIKSCLDYLAESIKVHFTGIQVNYSITPLVKLVDKGNSNELLDIIKKHKDWIMDIREYRDTIIHRGSINTGSGHEIQKRGEIEKRIVFPIVIPRKNPKNQLDTRETRMKNISNNVDRFNFSEFETFKTENGKKILTDFDRIYLPRHDEIEISQFMKENLNRLSEFIVEIISVISDKIEFSKLKDK